MKARAVKTWLIMVLSCLTLWGRSQDAGNDIFIYRHVLIDSLAKKDAWEEMIPVIESQLKYMDEKQAWDSAYKYVYPLGMAFLETKGADACAARTQKLISHLETHLKNKTFLMKSLSRASDVYYNAGRDSLCLEVDLLYLAVCNSYPEATVVQRAQANYALGFDYHVLFGNSAKAVHYFKNALDIVAPDSAQYEERFLYSLNALGAAHYRNGTFAEAKQYLNRGLAYIDNLPENMDRWLSEVDFYGNLSLIYQDEGNLLQAKKYVNKVIQMRLNVLNEIEPGIAKERQKRLLIISYHNLASIHLEMVDVSKAYALTMYVDKLRKEWLAPDHPDNNKTFEALGSIQYSSGDYDEAMANYQKYLEYNIAKNGRHSYYTALSYNRIGKVAFEQGDYAKAIENYTEAIAIGEEITYDESSQDLAMVYMLRALPLSKLKRFAEAEMDLRKAQSIYTKTLPPESGVLSQAVIFYSWIKLQQNDYDSAHYYVDVAIAKLTSLPENNPHLMAYADVIKEAYQMKAQIILAQSGDVAALKQAEQLFEKSLKWVRTWQYSFQGESSVLVHFDNSERVFTRAKELYNDLRETTGDASYIDRIYETDEEAKSVLLRQHLNRLTLLQSVNVPDSVLQAEQKYISMLSDMNKNLEVFDDIIDIEESYDNLKTFIAKNYPNYYAMRYSNDVAKIEDIQSVLLEPKQTLVQYISTEKGLLALVVTQTTKHIVKLNAPSYFAEIDSLNHAIVGLDQSTFLSLAERLYTSLFEPLEPLLAGEEIYIIPTGRMANLNFEVLVRPQGAGATPDYLLRHYTISYLLSSTTAVQYRGLRRNAPYKMLSFAPGFSDATKEHYRKSVTHPDMVDDEYFYHIQQPFAVRAAVHVASLFSGRAFVANSATEKNFTAEAGNYRIIHLGTHTQINNISPLLSRLVLTKDTLGDDEGNDGYLHAYEIYNMRLRAELAVLTACETGVGKHSASEGMQSLAHSFAYAGCPSIVMSLWQIDEQTSSGIVEGFYGYLSKGYSKNDALRRAKLDYLDGHSGDLVVPYYWSGLVLVGDVSPIGKEAGSWWFFVMMGLVALVVVWMLVGGSLRSRRR